MPSPNASPQINIRVKREVHARLAKLVPLLTEQSPSGAVVPPAEIARRALMIGLAALERDATLEPGCAA